MTTVISSSRTSFPPEQVEGLQEECQRYIDRYDAEMEAKGVTVQGINHYKKRYFISRRGLESPTITDFLFGDLMGDICNATLGDDAFLFHEQYVVKFAEVGTKFGWHQDSGYVGHYHRPYLSCWCALDDMSIENGTVSVLPYSAIGMTPDDLYDHEIESGSNDKIGYQGDHPGVPALVPRGKYSCIQQPYIPPQRAQYDSRNAALLSGAVFCRGQS